LKRLSNKDILAAEPARKDLLAELAWWERNQFKLCILGEEPDTPPDIPELKGMLDYFMESKDYYAVAQRIGQLRRIVKE
jgi:hypothetical protein